jgi:hypothetical protein
VGRQVWAKNPKPTLWGSVSGMPLETAVVDNRGRWLGSVCEVAIVVVGKMQGRDGVWAKKPKLS